jgi:hypothetical protein
LFWTVALMASAVSNTSAQAGNTSLDVTVRGVVPNLCGIKSSTSTLGSSSVSVELPVGANTSLGALSASGEISVGVKLSCNSKFEVSLQSQYGGLQHTDPLTSHNGAFTTQVPYRIGWEVGLDDGGSAGVSGCNSSALREVSGCSATSAYSAMNKELTARMAWDGAPASSPLLAGDFKDVMTIRLTATGW